jgi:3-oxoacyl-[acyl-carrier-protein] synthase-3
MKSTNIKHIMSKTLGIGVLGTGRYVPSKLLTNEEIEIKCKLAPGTILEKTGIKRRFIVEDKETASSMSAACAMQALAASNVLPEQIKLIICCTFSGDYIYPALACKVQELIGAKNAGSFDLMANCTSFQVGLTVASDRMKCDSSIDYALVIGVALQSRYINFTDPDTAIYFGDGAGAAVIGNVPEGYGILASEIFTNSSVFEAVRMRGGGSSYPMRLENVEKGLQYYEMNGMEVWKQVMQHQPKAIKRVLDKIGKIPTDVDFFVFHQANLNLINYLMSKMKQPLDKTLTNVDDIGNTADASLPIALHDVVITNRIKRDDLVVITGVGAGFTFGATVIKWF